MQALTDLAYLLNRYAIRDIDIIANPERKKNREDSRYWEFYLGIKENKWKTEEEIAQAFGYVGKTSKGFRRLKETFKERVVTTLLFIEMDANRYSEHEIKTAELAKLTAIACMLHARESKQLFLEVGQKALNMAIETKNAMVAQQLLSMFIGFYSLQPSRSKEYKRTIHLMAKYSEWTYLESQLKIDFNDCMVQIANRKGYRKGYSGDVKKKYEKYVDKLSEIDSSSFQVMVRQLGVFEHLLCHQWQEVLALCDDAIEMFDNTNLVDHGNKSLFNSQKSSALVMLGRHKEALELLDNDLKKIEPGHKRWYKNREMAAIACFYGDDYKQALEIVRNAFTCKRFACISEVNQETWRLYNAYLHLIARVEGSGLQIENAQKFKLGKMLNEMPYYSQDKRGGNTTLLILQVLFLLSEMGKGKNILEEIESRLESVRKYAERNLDPNSEHMRTTLFLQMLLLVPKYLHEPQNLQKAVHAHLQKMRGIEAMPIDSSFELEVVPYEQQWSWVMGFVEAAQTMTHHKPKAKKKSLPPISHVTIFHRPQTLTQGR
jgi:hypothetical protein